MTKKKTDEETCDCFWQGGFIRYACIWMSGVMITLIFIGGAILETKGAELDLGKRVGHCEEACAAKEMRFESFEGTDHCVCVTPYNEHTHTATHSQP